MSTIPSLQCGSMKTIVIGTQKGGVGKSTISLHLAYHAARTGRRTLLIDLDEGDLRTPIPGEDDPRRYIHASQLFHGNLAPERLCIAPGLDLIPADNALLDVDDEPLDIVYRLAETLGQWADTYDLCVLDTPPNLQRRMIAALTAADGVVCPLQIAPYAIGRMEKMAQTVAHVQAHYNPSLLFLGYMLNLFNVRSPHEKEGLIELREAYGDLMFDTVIPTRACVPASLAAGQPVWHNITGGNQRLAAREMRKACQAILDRLDRKTAV